MENLSTNPKQPHPYLTGESPPGGEGGSPDSLIAGDIFPREKKSPASYTAEEFYRWVALLDRLHEQNMLTGRDLARQIAIEASMFVESEVLKQCNEALGLRQLNKIALGGRQ
ncbi:MAG: hypothetical protein OXU41_06980 [Gammaproteobacteria bacterium]|nr:hypothetical protein [Gammaproteobacteria bacterium]MDD9871244.1 hypothetical protein [Gammaproteobacteria bacterium]